MAESKGKTAQRETYAWDDIATVRSFMRSKDLAELPIPLTPIIKEHLISMSSHSHANPIPEDMLILEHYVRTLQLINLFGYHTKIPKMLERFCELSQEKRRVDFSRADVQGFIRNGGENPYA